MVVRMIWMIAVVLAAGCNARPEANSTPAASATTVVDICRPNPDPATPDVQVIDTPKAGDAVRSPFNVSGRIAAFEATFAITLFDANGRPIVDMTAMSLGGQTLSRFSEQVTFPGTAAGAACLWVYERSARDGAPIHVGQMPLTLLPPGGQ